MNEQETFVAEVRRRLVGAGLTEATLVSAAPESAAFGDTSAIFSLGQFLLRVVRDRGEEFLDVGSAGDPAAFCQYDDLAIAMGWRSIAEILAKQSPEPLERVFEELARRLPELLAAFSPSRATATAACIDAAARKRGEALVARLAAVSPSPR